MRIATSAKTIVIIVVARITVCPSSIPILSKVVSKELKSRGRANNATMVRTNAANDNTIAGRLPELLYSFLSDSFSSWTSAF